MGEKNEIAVEKGTDFKVNLTNALTENKLALPKDFNEARFVQNCLYLMNSNDKLSEFASNNKTGLAQIRNGMLRGAYLGLDFMSKECYLIPYKETLDFQMSYNGSRKLAKKYSIRPILDIYAEVVRQGDEFENGSEDGQQYIKFKAKPFNEGAIIGAFAECKFADGGVLSTVMSKKELDKCKRASKSGGTVWTQWEEEMCKKSVIKRLCKNIEISFDSPQQTEAFNEYSEDEKPVVEVPDIDIDAIDVEGEIVE